MRRTDGGREGRRVAAFLAGVLLVAGASACGAGEGAADGGESDAREGAPSSAPPERMVLPTHDRPVEMRALLSGRLVQDGPCLGVTGRKGGVTVPIWPDGYSYADREGSGVVLDARREVAAVVGRPLVLTGGLAEASDSSLNRELGEARGCGDAYWFVAAVRHGR
ncbi:MAG TPA: hypothetical protein VG318_14170 [Actinomycetota bacterium]|nr:hypothetical protein [Actinomycetota bacterium]